MASSDVTRLDGGNTLFFDMAGIIYQTLVGGGLYAGGEGTTARLDITRFESNGVMVGLGRKCSKCPSTHSKPSILELNSII